MIVSKRGLALFDFDGTLIDRDSLFAFVRHARGPLRFIAGLVWLSPMLVRFRLGMLSGEHAKVAFLRHYLGGMPRERMAELGERFVPVLDRWLRPGARERLAWHRDQGHDVWLVSASLDLWLAPFAAHHGLSLICTRAAWTTEGRFAGQFEGPNVNGPEKARQIRHTVDLDAYDQVWAYGDTEGDRQMLELADVAEFRPFRSR